MTYYLSPGHLFPPPEGRVGILPEEDELVVDHEADDAAGTVAVLARRGAGHRAGPALTQPGYWQLSFILLFTVVFCLKTVYAKDYHLLTC